MKVSVEIHQSQPRVVFQFEEINPRIFIQELPKAKDGTVEFKRHVLYESREDRMLNKLVGELTKTAGLVIQHNFADGRDDIDTPDDLARALVDLKTLTAQTYRERGQKRAFATFGRAKQHTFESQKIRDLTGAEQFKLTEILRWHMEDAINNPPPSHPALRK